MKKNLYSPSMFKSYLNCKYTIFNEFYEEKLKLKRTEDTESDKLRLAKGNQFENDYLKELQKKYSKVVDLKKGDKEIPKEEIAKQTVKCMKEGYEVIRGGYLIDGKWRGEFDFLEINRNVKSNLGNYSYEVSDTKNTTKIKPDHIFQVATYADLLEKTQGIKSKNFNIVLKEMKKEKVELENVSEFVLMQKKKYEYFFMNCNLSNINNLSNAQKKEIFFTKFKITDDNMITNSYSNTPIYFYDPIVQLNQLGFKFYYPDNSLVDFKDRDHSFVLEITTIDNLPALTAINPNISIKT